MPNSCLILALFKTVKFTFYSLILDLFQSFEFDIIYPFTSLF